jgi:acyl dehydratase
VNVDAVKSLELAPITGQYDEKDAILYALSLGLGSDASDERVLEFVGSRVRRVMPTMASIMASAAGAIIAAADVDFKGMVHGEQRLRFHKPLSPAAQIVSTGRCLSVVDKGAEHGAILNIESVAVDAVSGDALFSSIMSLFCRRDGGFGGSDQGGLASHAMPDRPHETEAVHHTQTGQALLYQLNGDRNPLHTDPQTARRAGFEGPILHGLCTYGIACRAVLETYCDLDPSRIAEFDARFSKPVYPGDTITTRFWRDGQTVSFECWVDVRKTKVITNGRCVLRD